MYSQSLFITGTDTDVGKTTIALGLLAAANDQGLLTAAIKPVAAGCESTEMGLRNRDALLLQSASSYQLSYQQVNPVCLQAPMAPHIAACREGESLSAPHLADSCQRLMLLPIDMLVIEGAGGWFVPLNDRETLADIPRELNCAVILVVGLRLGCINHALLTARAIHADGLKLLGWIGNVMDSGMLGLDENIAALKKLILAPCLGIVPKLTDVTPEQVSNYINLPAEFEVEHGRE